jgi:hypothetical protein
VFVRDLDAIEARPVAGTEGARSMFWSPDAQSVGFDVGRTLKRVGIAGGPVLTIAETTAADSLGGSFWTRDGIIVFGGTRAGAIRRVSESGGAVTAVTALDQTRGDLVHGLARALPDGRHFLYTRISAAPDQSGVFVGALDRAPADQPLTRLLAASNAVYAESPSGTGYVLYLQKGTLMAHRFDVTRLALAGEPVAIAEGVGNLGSYGFFSAGGAHLGYRTGPRSAAGTHAQLQWMGRDGTPKDAPVRPAAYDSISLTPDGARAAVVLAGLADAGLGNIDIWVIDLSRGVPQRLTTDPATDRFPVWSPDQTRIVYNSVRGDVANLYRRRRTARARMSCSSRPIGRRLPRAGRPITGFCCFKCCSQAAMTSGCCRCPATRSLSRWSRARSTRRKRTSRQTRAGSPTPPTHRSGWTSISAPSIQNHPARHQRRFKCPETAAFGRAGRVKGAS